MDKELLKKFLQDRCTNEEYQKVITWYNTHGEEELLKLIEEDWHQWEDYDAEKIGELQHILQKTHSMILEDQLDLANKEKYIKPAITSYRPYNYHRYTVAVMASFLLVLATLFVFRYFNPSDVENLGEIKRKYVPFGQKATIYLDDGTKVVLNAGSEIKYAEKFSKTSREVWLEGEGFFEVVKDPDRPFSVVSGNLTTVALGTSFNVRAYKGEENIEVALATGKVEVRGNRENGITPVVLAPGELVNLDMITGESRKENFSASEKLGWTENLLYFKEAKAREIFATLERWYGVKFIFNKELREEWEYSGEFKNKSLETVLEGIAYVKEFRFSFKEGKQVEIDFK